jgi:hypothetical protein
MIKKFSFYNESVFKPKKVKEREKEVISKGLFMHKFISECNVIFEKKSVKGEYLNDGEVVKAWVQGVPQIRYNPLRLYNECKLWNLVEHECYREGYMKCDAYINGKDIVKVETSVENLIFPSEVVAKEMCHYLISQCLFHIEEIANLDQADRVKMHGIIEKEVAKMVQGLKDRERVI